MTGIEAITAQNGWAMAVVGAVIVMIALTILATTISQVHKVIFYCESRLRRCRQATDAKSEENPDRL